MAIITYKCPNCGGDLRFDPESQSYRCEYCLSKFTQEQLDEAAKKTEGRTEESGADTDNAMLYNCPNCGAEIVTEEGTTATFCYYCHTPVVMAGKMSGKYLPNYAVPFAVDREKALDIFDQWIRKKKFVPNAFYSREQVDKMTGVYFPYWLYSCEVDGKLDAEGLKHKTWTSGDTRFTQTDKYNVSREGQMQVNHVTRNALSKANRKLIEGVLPFDMGKLVPFHMGYLSGFMAEKRDMDEDKFQTEVQQEVKAFAGQTMKNDLTGYDSIRVRSEVENLSDEKWEYALMPVWTLTYRDPKQDKIYYFACNGQTGKVCGELPVDSGKLMRLFASISVPLFAVLLVVGYFL